MEKFEWKKWLAVVLVSLAAGLSGGGAIAPLCGPACNCCQPSGDEKTACCECAGDCCKCEKK